MYRSYASDMGPVNLVVGHRQELGLCPLLHWLWIVSGAIFLGSGGIYPNLSVPRERLPCMGTAHRKRTLGVRGLAWEAYVSCWSGFPLQSVHRFESPRLSDMSNRLFVAVIT
jgi:hypothetical protein